MFNMAVKYNHYFVNLDTMTFHYFFVVLLVIYSTFSLIVVNIVVMRTKWSMIQLILILIAKGRA